MLLKQLNHAIQIGIASAKPPREPVSTALGNRFAVRNYVKLTGLSGSNHGCNAEVLLMRAMRLATFRPQHKLAPAIRLSC
jgi:hypothetical protein